MTHEYVCASCRRTIDPDLEPSPGEPTRCQDCTYDLEREDRIDQLIREGLQRGWGAA